MPHNDHKNIVFAGPSGTGKTSIINQYVGRDLNEFEQSTLGCQTTYLNKMTIQEVGGNPRFKAFHKMSYKDAQAIVLVAHAMTTTQDMDDYIQDIPDNAHVYLVINCGEKSLECNQEQLDQLKADIELQLKRNILGHLHVNGGTQELFQKINAGYTIQKQPEPQTKSVVIKHGNNELIPYQKEPGFYARHKNAIQMGILIFIGLAALTVATLGFGGVLAGLGATLLLAAKIASSIVGGLFLTGVVGGLILKIRNCFKSSDDTAAKMRKEMEQNSGLDEENSFESTYKKAMASLDENATSTPPTRSRNNSRKNSISNSHEDMGEDIGDIMDDLLEVETMQPTHYSSSLFPSTESTDLSEQDAEDIFAELQEKDPLDDDYPQDIFKGVKGGTPPTMIL